MEIHAETRMSDLLAAFPGARRALFKGFHVGGCQSCGFSDEDTLAAVAQKHDKEVGAMIAYLTEAREQEQALVIEPEEAMRRAQQNEVYIIDLRSPEAYAEDHMPGAELISEAYAEEVMTWAKETPLIMYCQNGVGSLNAVNYMADYGFTNVTCIKGGYEALRPQLA